MGLLAQFPSSRKLLYTQFAELETVLSNLLITLPTAMSLMTAIIFLLLTTIGTWLTTPTNQGRLGYTIGTWLTTPTNHGQLGYTIGTWLTNPANQGRLGYTIRTWLTTPRNQGQL